MLQPDQQRRFALDVTRRLREAGFEAYWAGGCVRDELLGRLPKDYDVATNATPSQIRKLFGFRRTLAIGAAFGVITVKGSPKAGMIEVTTFRSDACYSDGRHPDQVTFSSPAEDAARRDFTINGLFFDPVQQRVIDFVDGQADLARGVIRAIGNAHERFAEDKLRMLRAARFAATFDFALEEQTAQAIRQMAGELPAVSPERIAMEMRRMLTEPGRVRAVRLLIELGLAEVALPDLVGHDDVQRRQFERSLAALGRLQKPTFPLAIATLLDGIAAAPRAKEIGLGWRLSNKEIDRIVWLVENRQSLGGALAAPWSKLQPPLIHEGVAELLALHEVIWPDGPDEAEHCRRLLQQPPELLDPPPLPSGNDLMAHGIPSGPIFKTLLQCIRAAQLDGLIHTPAEALAFADEMFRKHNP